MSMFSLKGSHWTPENAMPPTGQYLPCTKQSPGHGKGVRHMDGRCGRETPRTRKRIFWMD